VAEGRLITTHDLIGLTRTNPTLSSTGPALTDCGPTSRSAPGAVRALNDAERDLIARALAANGGNKSDTARQLGLSRRALYRRLVKHGLDQGEAHNGSLPTNS
jgi:DNA-binding NtrC family response regulator